jgi:hypothetical protein
MIIGLYSPVPQSGKSTIARHLATGHGFQVLPMAQPLRDMLGPLLLGLGLSQADAERYLRQDKATPIPGLGCTARHLMQTLGTDWGRLQVHPDLWVRCWSAQAAQHRRLVADDVRFSNEAAAIHALGGQVWKVWRPDAVLDCPHASEGNLDDWDGFDRVIANDASLEQLMQQVESWLE